MSRATDPPASPAKPAPAVTPPPATPGTAATLPTPGTAAASTVAVKASPVGTAAGGRSSREPSLRSRLSGTSPTVYVGIGLLVAGIVLSVVLPGRSLGGDASASLNSAFSGAIQLVQRAILWGDRTVSDTQPKFNAAVVAVFLEGLSPAQQDTLGTAVRTTTSLFSELVSIQGLVTLAVLGVVYYFVARAFDARFPDAGPKHPE